MSRIIKQAFTLIELLVVIAIIGILSGLIIVGMNGMTDKANIAKLQVFSNSLRNSLMMNIVAQYSFDDIDSSDYNSSMVLNNDAGNVPDSWSNNEGRAYGGPILKDESNCVSGKCLSFDGTDAYVDVANSASLDVKSSGTVGFWVKKINAGNVGYVYLTQGPLIYSADGNYVVVFWRLPCTGFSYVDGSGNGYTYAASITQNKWYYVTVVWKNGNQIQIFINGEIKVNDTGLSFPTQSGSSALNYGQYWSGAWLQGLMDDIRIYNAAIPTSQIKEQYYAGLNGLLASGQINAEEYSQRISSVAKE